MPSSCRAPRWAPSKGMIVLSVFATVGAALALWAGEEPGSDRDLRRRARTPADRGADARMSVAPDDPCRAQLLLLASQRGLRWTRT